MAFKPIIFRKKLPTSLLNQSNNNSERRTGIMETKSRYEVIAELEGKKRDLIREKSQLDDRLKEREKNLKLKEREKSDTILELDREIEDLNEEIDNYKTSMEERKETIEELIKSMDESLERFGELSKSNSQKTKN